MIHTVVAGDVGDGVGVDDNNDDNGDSDSVPPTRTSHPDLYHLDKCNT